jgi:hypothetical protein
MYPRRPTGQRARRRRYCAHAAIGEIIAGEDLHALRHLRDGDAGFLAEFAGSFLSGDDDVLAEIVVGTGNARNGEQQCGGKASGNNGRVGNAKILHGNGNSSEARVRAQNQNGPRRKKARRTPRGSKAQMKSGGPIAGGGGAARPRPGRTKAGAKDGAATWTGALTGSTSKAGASNVAAAANTQGGCLAALSA